MFFVLLSIVFIETGLITLSPLERFVEALFWTTLGTHTVIRGAKEGLINATAILCLQQVF